MAEPLSDAEVVWAESWSEGHYADGQAAVGPEWLGRCVATIRGLEAENARLREALDNIDACWVSEEKGGFIAIPRSALEHGRSALLVPS